MSMVATVFGIVGFCLAIFVLMKFLGAICSACGKNCKYLLLFDISNYASDKYSKIYEK